VKPDDLIAKSSAASASLLVQRGMTIRRQLLDLGDPPSFLYALGDPSLANRRRVGIVGTRHASSSGDRIAHEMAALLARQGVVVVSGMALGIDAAAHRGALDAGGGTIAVLGGGVDVPYPPTHRALHARIVGEGLALSEAPLGSHPVLGAFPKRNRIIAALSETLIVVEAGERSGALITSRLALELGRTVAAVPGPIDSPRHVGSNRLLSEGAAFIARVEDVLSIAGIDAAEKPTAESRPDDVVPDAPSHAAILNAVRAGASDLEDLARSTRLAPREFATALSTLELTGKLTVTATGAVSVPESQ
jgi:DNA processing protein